MNSLTSFLHSMTNLPEPPKAEVWYYKLIYLVNETEHIGQWSDVQSISVHG